MAKVLKLQSITNVEATDHQVATLFIFHGAEGSGSEMKMWIDFLNGEELKFPHIKIVYPTAPLQPYTPLKGTESNVWFDRQDLLRISPEKKESINQICEIMCELIDNEVRAGIPLDHIILSGFSMGGALALHLAYRYKTSIAGCITMSSFLNQDSLVYEAVDTYLGKKLPPLLQFHGLEDSMIPFKWSKRIHETMKAVHVDCKLIPLPDVGHELIPSEIKQLKEFVLNTFSGEHFPKF